MILLNLKRKHGSNIKKKLKFSKQNKITCLLHTNLQSYSNTIYHYVIIIKRHSEI